MGLLLEVGLKVKLSRLLVPLNSHLGIVQGKEGMILRMPMLSNCRILLDKSRMKRKEQEMRVQEIESLMGIIK